MEIQFDLIVVGAKNALINKALKEKVAGLIPKTMKYVCIVVGTCWTTTSSDAE